MPISSIQVAGKSKPAPLSKEEAIRKSYQVLGLLTVCEHAITNLENVGPANVCRIAGSIGEVVEIARGIASELHDALELEARR